jgi:hypothetical protein
MGRMNRKALIAAGLGGLMLLAPADAQVTYGVTVYNNTGTAIQVFRFTACRAPWGPDRLGSTEVIAPGASRHFDMSIGIRDCCRDLRAEFANGAVRERMDFDVCKESRWEVY